MLVPVRTRELFAVEPVLAVKIGYCEPSPVGAYDVPDPPTSVTLSNLILSLTIPPLVVTVIVCSLFFTFVLNPGKYVFNNHFLAVDELYV